VIDLSADLGEGSPRESEIWPLIHSANVACGGHVGDEASMHEAAQLAKRYNVRLGAHPSYPDRENFGRRSMSIAPAALRESLIAQLTSLRDIAGTLHHVKPHGALYNEAHHDRALAEIIVDALRAVDDDLALVCAATSQMAAAAHAAHIPVIREAFADRRYAPDGSLTPRSDPTALLNVAESAEQAELLAEDGVVITSEGTTLLVPFDTLCIHADMDHAVERLQAIRTRLGI
jgi:UPF0271 protein